MGKYNMVSKLFGEAATAEDDRKALRGAFDLFILIFLSLFRRRTLKNRGYAASCRIKRLEQKGDLEHEKGKEYEDLDHVQVTNNNLHHFCIAMMSVACELLRWQKRQVQFA